MNESQLNALSVSKALRYREQEGYVGKGGVVVLYDLDVCGWCQSMPSPSDWRPGCLAIDEDGNQWVSQAGSAQVGAERWTLLTPSMRCERCGSTRTQISLRRSGHLSCCPERRMVEVVAP